MSREGAFPQTGPNGLGLWIDGPGSEVSFGLWGETRGKLEPILSELRAATPEA